MKWRVSIVQILQQLSAATLGVLLSGWLQVAAASASEQAVAPSEAAEQAMGTHGMVLFGGKDGLFASHLPMFHPPHHYQVLLKIQLADRRLDASVRTELEKSDQLWTISPERFDLLRINRARSPMRKFKATLYRGHFERGGTPIHADVEVQIHSVMRFQSLALTPTPNGNAVAPNNPSDYLLIQSGTNAFLVHIMTQRPSFDHIVRLSTTEAIPASFQQLTVDRTAENPGLTADPADLSAINSALRAARVPANAKSTLYFEAEELR